MDVLIFLIVLEVIGLLAFPLALTLAGNLRDSGYSLARPIGIIIISLVASLLSFIRLVPLTAGVYAGLLVLAALAAFIVYIHRCDLRHSSLKHYAGHRFIADLHRSYRKTDRDWLIQEGLFVVTFLLATLFLMHKPEIFFGYSEDFMNAAFLQSLLQTDYLPLLDPWFAGTGLTYYYLGHLATAVLVVLSGVQATVGYNLAVATFFAIGVQTAFGLGLNLTERRLYGFAAAFLTMVSGFPAGFVQLLSYLSEPDNQWFQNVPGSLIEWFSAFDFTTATCTIPQTINFYPFFTFLQGDLHAHFVSIPFLLTLIGLCLALSKKFSWTTFSAALIVTVFLVGLNAWNLPVSLFLLAWTAYVVTKKKAFLFVIGLAGCIFVASLCVGLVGIVDPGRRTDLSGFLLIFGVFAFISFAYLIDSHKFSRKDGLIAVSAIVVLVIAFLLNFPLAIAALLAIPFFYRAWFGEEYPALLAGIALLMITFCELFFINDPYGPPYERMNTVMKFYLQAWVFWGIASAYFLFRIKNRILVAGAIVLIIIAVIHPMGTLVSMPNTNYMGETETLTLDGSVWLKEQKPDDYNALCWLRETAKRGEVVLEAPGDAYSYSSRVSAFTGLPTVIGWRTHEVMWGRGGEDIEQRCADIDCMYTEGAQERLAKYHVRYIFVGETEQKKYGSDLETLAGCDEIELAYRSGNTCVYRVI
ncbi:DUF2298 domain-containing protein [Methanogenium sp. MK-MG]|uniref:DUF2298 domain-containing protein n=1 Tax=Methanogenium sp. MK-MG TaxID=2599926 RepID=UPI0013EAF1F7|nr:DUF2298 domain-containing protein [Methanogenium sp. MK-MG]KAF1074032.1 hypothetical protein MKMG_02030 [Methanogenium sp. MK-MG]